MLLMCVNEGIEMALDGDLLTAAAFKALTDSAATIYGSCSWRVCGGRGFTRSAPKLPRQRECNPKDSHNWYAVIIDVPPLPRGPMSQEVRVNHKTEMTFFKNVQTFYNSTLDRCGDIKESLAHLKEAGPVEKLAREMGPAARGLDVGKSCAARRAPRRLGRAGNKAA